MLRVDKRAYDEAWQDLLACHRLGRFVGQGGTLIESLISFGTEIMASTADLAFLDWSGLNAKQIEACLKDLQTLPPVTSLANKMDLFERFEFLDCIMRVDRHGLRYIDEKYKDPLDEKILPGIDWDPGLRFGNEWFDRFVAAMREKEPSTRRSKLKELDSDFCSVYARWFTYNWDREQLRDEVSIIRGKRFGQFVLYQCRPNGSVKMPRSADRSQQIFDNTITAFALAWYQRDHGYYPKHLSDLAPKYLPQAPLDIFTDKPLYYLPSDKGYFFYSVGINGIDDGGRGPEDDPPGDDLRVRMPLP
jgi:hypothetical protein